jgi:hypothetical protein
MGLVLENPGKRLSLWVEGYEDAGEVDSANWLVIGIEAEIPPLSWRASDAAMTVDELAGLKRWFECLLAGTASSEFEFIEPNLGFECLDQSLNSRSLTRLRVWFDGELAPPGVFSGTWGENRICADFDLSAADVTRAAISLQALAASFPNSKSS